MNLYKLMHLFSKIYLNIWVVITIWITTTSPAFAHNQADLGKVQKAISATQMEIKNTTIAQKQIGTSLQETDAKLSLAQAQLTALNKQQHISTQRLIKLQNDLDNTQVKISATQTQVARLLNAHYRNQQPNSINILLNHSQIDQKGRILQYLRYLNNANEQIINQLQQQKQQLEDQQRNLTAQQKQLAILKAKQQALVKQLNQTHQVKLQQNNKLDKQLVEQNKKLQKLKADEKRMSALLSRLTAKTTRKKLQQQQKSATINKTSAPNRHKNTQKEKLPAQSSLTAEDLALKADNNNDIHETGTFVSQQGSLYRPVNTPITHYFGTSRSEAGTWKGLFFATKPTAVHSIARGIVIYASTLQGYGNTVIIDHGDGYLSIYAGLTNIFVHSTQTVTAGLTIGTSGHFPDQEDGLYFEIRYHNKPMNPLSWIN